MSAIAHTARHGHYIAERTGRGRRARRFRSCAGVLRLDLPRPARRRIGGLLALLSRCRRRGSRNAARRASPRARGGKARAHRAAWRAATRAAIRASLERPGHAGDGPGSSARAAIDRRPVRPQRRSLPGLAPTAWQRHAPLPLALHSTARPGAQRRIARSRPTATDGAGRGWRGAGADLRQPCRGARRPARRSADRCPRSHLSGSSALEAGAARAAAFRADPHSAVEPPRLALPSRPAPR